MNDSGRPEASLPCSGRRLSASHAAAIKYMAQFPSHSTATAARFVVFVVVRATPAHTRAHTCMITSDASTCARVNAQSRQ